MRHDRSLLVSDRFGWNNILPWHHDKSKDFANNRTRIRKLQTPNQAREKLCLPKIKNAIEKENDRLLELCMFALLPKRIYNHELADKTKEAFKNIIKKNINEDTYTIRNKIVRY